MSSKREEERNEKIIRGLMKLPPNRKCINCNSVGPQYVCTNFWTFVCTACSGIHREFTHRVKSVSMAKFTTKEVEALQKGGNQLAREIFLKDWDMQRMRFPDSSNADKIREFIKDVYVNKKYAGGKPSGKPPRDMESFKNHELEQRRASSYHSFSQSPPYEYQYEDRRYGKQFGMLNRKPGSDRGHYDGKMNSFIYSPGRLHVQTYEDRFANESSGSRMSDFSVSSAGDTFRYDGQSLNSQDTGCSSPSLYQTRDIIIEDARPQTLNQFTEANVKKDLDGMPCPKRTSSASSFGSLDSSYISHRSFGSVSVGDVALEPVHLSGTQHAKTTTFSSSTQSSASVCTGNKDLFSSSFVQEPKTSSPFIDLFADFSNQPSSMIPIEHKPAAVPIPQNEGWATFDLPHHVGVDSALNSTSAVELSGSGAPKGSVDGLASLQNNSDWFPVQNPVAPGPLPITSGQWHLGLQEHTRSAEQNNSQSNFWHRCCCTINASDHKLWNAFDESTGKVPQTSVGGLQQNGRSWIPASESALHDQNVTPKVLEDFDKDGFQNSAMDALAPGFDQASGVAAGSPFSPSVKPLMGGATQAQKSTNPFDLPYDVHLEPMNAFLDMSSLGAALPSTQLTNDYLAGVAQPWYSQNAAATYVSSLPEGGLQYIPGQAPSTHFPNFPPQGPGASIGGNPFA